jgi:hypothetical protein
MYPNSNIMNASLERQRAFLDELMITLNYSSLEDFYNLSLAVLTEHEGSELVDIYSNSIPRMLEAVYPEYDWMFWMFPKASNGAWKVLANQRKFMDALGKRLGYTKLDDWYNCRHNDITGYGGHALFNIHGSMVNVLEAVYPGQTWIPWRFGVVRKIWRDMDLSTQRTFMEYLKGELGFSKIEDWYKVTALNFMNNKGSGLLAKYARSPIQVLQNVYPEYDWKPWRFQNCPKDTWDDFENHRGFMDDLKVKLGYTTMDDWYKLTYDVLQANKGRQLLGRYNHSTSLVVRTVYPEYDWKFWRFAHASQGSWASMTNCKEYMEFLRNILGYQTYEDWYKVKRGDFRDNEGGGILDYFESPSKVMKAVYPEYHWVKTKFCSNYSRVSLEWLRYVEIRQNIKIQHAESEGEYQIPGTRFKADGYCKDTNTVFEFAGSYWHGDPRVYDSGEYNRVSKKTFGELYSKTVEREKVIKDMGFNIVVMWEMDWTLIHNKAKIIQRAFRKRKLSR